MSPAVHVSDVTMTFGSATIGATMALGPMSLTVDAGEVVTIIGPSGCGKTTLLRMIAGLATPTTGSVSVEGRPPEVAQRDKRIGYVPQAPALLPWRTVEANARLLRDVNRQPHASEAPDPMTLLDEVGLADFANAYPHELSGGMQQRVALVRAFAIGPSVLLLDEPFAALDEIARADARHLLATLCERHSTTVVFVTHSIAEALYLGDRVVVLSPRPGVMIADQAVPFGRPRRPELEDDPAFFELATRLRSALRTGAGR